MVYWVANLLIEKVCIIKNFDEANFSDFKRLVVNVKINPQKYNWPQKTCKTPQQYISRLKLECYCDAD